MAATISREARQRLRQSTLKSHLRQRRVRLKYLSFISKYSADVIKKKICSERGWGITQTFEGCFNNALLFEEGIEPTRENFKAWNITKEGLVFSFDPCQLVGCAAGGFYVNVPYSEIKDLLKPNNATSRISAS